MLHMQHTMARGASLFPGGGELMLSREECMPQKGCMGHGCGCSGYMGGDVCIYMGGDAGDKVYEKVHR